MDPKIRALDFKCKDQRQSVLDLFPFKRGIFSE